MKKLLPLIGLLLISSIGLNAQVLGIGQIAMVGIDTDGEDFTFVALDNIPVGTQIYFSDKPMVNDSTINASSGEGVILWTAPGTITCGTVVRRAASPGDFVNIQGSFALGNGGDNIIAFQGYNTTTGVVDSFLHAISSNGSYNSPPLPKGLMSSDIPRLSLDNGQYIGNKVDTDALLFSTINTVNGANWDENNSYGSVTLEDSSFTVTNCVLPGGTPTIQSSNIANNGCSFAQNSIDLGWSAGDGIRRIVVASKAPITGTPANNTTYSADAVFNNGQSTLNAGEFVVYDGNSNSVTVTGLANGTVYYFQIFEYNGSPGSEDYLTSPGTNNPMMLSTATRPSGTGVTTIQPFDLAPTANPWEFCSFPAQYNVSSDTWDTVTSFTNTSTSQTIIPDVGSHFFGMRDLNNPNNGLPISFADHWLDFQPIELNNPFGTVLSFSYWAEFSFAGTFDQIIYNVQYDTGTAWPSGSDVDIVSPNSGFISQGGWDTVSITIPGSATSVRLRIGGNFDGGNDMLGIDNVRLVPNTGATPPEALSASVINTTTVEVTYSQPMTAASAQTIGNYLGLTSPITSVSVTANPAIYRLNLGSPLAPGTQQLIVNNSTNIAATPMAGPDTVFVEIVPNVVISEIMYSPDGSDDLEFIEIVNLEAVPINLASYSFTEGFDYTFPNPSIVAPGQHLTIARNTGRFFTTFGFLPDHTWTSGNLTNAGEDIEITSPLGAQVAYVDYGTNGDWAAVAEGGGPSLTYCSAFYTGGTNNDPAQWGMSQNFITDMYDGNNYVYASPGAPECTNAWLGRSDSIWSNPMNWSLGTVPLLCVNDVVIGSSFEFFISGYSFPFILDDSTGNVNNLTITPFGELTIGIAPGDTGILQICGDYRNDGIPNLGYGALVFTGATDNDAIGGMRIGALTIGKLAGQKLNLTSGFEGFVRYGIGFGPSSGDLDIDPAASLTVISDSSGTGWIDDFTFGPTTGSIIGDVTIQRYVNNPGNAFHYLGSMTSGATAADWSDDFSIASTGATGGHLSHVIPFFGCDPTQLDPNSPYGGLFDYVESVVTNCELEGWRVIADGTYPLSAGTGFAGIIPNGTVVDVTGNPNTAKTVAITTPITATGTNTSAAAGYNLVANPFPSGLDWAVAGGAGVNPNIDGSAYIWESTGYYSGSLKEVNVMLPQVIASGQAFEVLALGNGFMNFTNIMRAQQAGAFVRQAPLYEARIDLSVEGNGKADRTHILFADEATNAYDRGYDSYNKNNEQGSPTIFSNLNTDELGIQSLPMFTGMESIEVGFIPSVNGSYTITAAELGTLPSSTLVFLEDKKDAVVHCLTVNQSYSFSATTQDAKDRFRLFFNEPVEPSSTTASCIGNDAVMTVDLGAVTWDSWTLFDASNNVVVSGANASGLQTVNQLVGGNYSLELNFQGHIITQGVTVQTLDLVEATIDLSTYLAEVGEMINFSAFANGANNIDVDLGDGTVISANNFDYAYTQAGTYEVVVSGSSDDCSDSDSKTVVVTAKTTGIEDLEQLGVQLIIADQLIKVRFDQPLQEEVSLNVYDLAGNMMFAKDDIQADQDISLDLAAGYYLVQLNIESNQIVKKLFLH